jgi:hypothetical protein
MGTGGPMRKEIMVTAAWTEVMIKFTDFAAGWGTPPPGGSDPKAIYGFDIATSLGTTGGDFEFWIDNIALYK